MMVEPLISCVMLTADRPHLIGTAVAAFHSQTWPNKELIVYDNGKVPVTIKPGNGVRVIRGAPATIGQLRNRANMNADGSVICHWDDDDWSSPQRVAEQFDLLNSLDAEIVGYRTVYFRVDRGERRPKYWLYYGEPDWVMASTMMYRRTTWENYPFRPVNNCEENEFIKPEYPAPGRPGPIVRSRRVIAADGHDPIRMIARHHAGCTSTKRTFPDSVPTIGDSWHPVSASAANRCEELLQEATQQAY
jgi:glycosyltransferase involved in cell wall biosynthesis